VVFLLTTLVFLLATFVFTQPTAVGLADVRLDAVHRQRVTVRRSGRKRAS